MNTNRIVFIINKLSGGGAERVISILANKIAEKNHEVIIITLFSNEVTYQISDSIEVINVSSKKKLRINRVLEKIHKIRKIIRTFKPLTIISFLYDVNMYTIIATRFIKDCKVIISERNDPYNEPNNSLGRFLRNTLYNFSNTLVCQTVEQRDYFSKKTREKSVIIGNPINPNLPIKTDIPENVIIGIGRLEYQKDFVTLIKAFEMFEKSNPNYILEIYGTGPLLDDLTSVTIDLNIQKKVRFMGYTQNIYEKLKRAKIFVLSSKFEGISNSLLESMAIGVPSISTDCPIYGSRSVIVDGVNGFLVKVGDYSAISTKMSLLVNNSTLYESISSESKKIRNEYSVDNIFIKWNDVIFGGHE